MDPIQLCGAAGVLVLIFVIGGLSGRRVKSSPDFETGGGKAGCGTVSGMVLGTVVGGSCTIGTAQLAYHNGLSAWWYTLGCGLTAGFRATVMFVPLTCACLLPGRIAPKWMLGAVLAGVVVSIVFSFWVTLPVDGTALGVAVGVLCCAVGAFAGRRKGMVRVETE